MDRSQPIAKGGKGAKTKKQTVRTGRKALSFLCVFALLIAMIPGTAFAGQASDISNHWAKAQIESMMDKGYFNGYQDGNFKPDQKITRAEFMAIINRAFNFTAKSEGSFADVTPGAWYADAVSQAKAAGYVSGYPDGSIRPDNTITRQEAAVIIAKIKQLTDMLLRRRALLTLTESPAGAKEPSELWYLPAL